MQSRTRPQTCPFFSWWTGRWCCGLSEARAPRPAGSPTTSAGRCWRRAFCARWRRLRQAAMQRTVVPAAYISLPGSREVAGALRLPLCPHDPVGDCGRHCRAIAAGQRGCDAVHGFTDRELYADSLAPGERSALFASRASVVRDHYGPHAVRFFYVNVGEEIARIEVPAWVADDPQTGRPRPRPRLGAVPPRRRLPCGAAGGPRAGRALRRRPRGLPARPGAGPGGPTACPCSRPRSSAPSACGGCRCR